MTFSTSIGEVTLGDVGNGCFVHPADEVVRRLTEEGTVRLPGTGGPLGVVFASDGGGRLFAVGEDGAVYRSSTASSGPDTAEFDRVADDLPQFLDLLHRSVLRFLRTGEPGYL